MSDKKTLILLAAIGSVIASATVPVVSFSQQAAPGSNQTGTEGGNTTDGSNMTTFEEEAMNSTQETNQNTTIAAPPSNTTTQGNVTNATATTTPAATAPPSNTTTQGNVTNATATAPPPSNATLAREHLEAQRKLLSDAYAKNITSGATKILMVTVSNQRGVPVEHEQRDIDPLGLIGFGDSGASMDLHPPTYASGENLTSTLYPGGSLSLIPEHVGMKAPDDIDIVLLSPDDMRSPIEIKDTGFDNSFVLPKTLENGHSYYVMVSMHWPDLHHDVLMGIKGKVALPQQTPE
jgi:hypothetical protein